MMNFYLLFSKQAADLGLLQVHPFNVTFTLAANNNYLYAMSFKIAQHQQPDTTQTAWPKVHSM